MSEQVKTLDDLKRFYIKHRMARLPGGGSFMTAFDGQGSFIDIQQVVGKEFDDFLAQVRREAKAEAWDEGYADCLLFHQSHGLRGSERNPYIDRLEQEGKNDD